jgi:hypothetical protein
MTTGSGVGGQFGSMLGWCGRMRSVIQRPSVTRIIERRSALPADPALEGLYVEMGAVEGRVRPRLADTRRPPWLDARDRLGEVMNRTPRPVVAWKVASMARRRNWQA